MRIYINSLGKADSCVRKTITEDNTKLLPEFQIKTDTFIAGWHYNLLNGKIGQQLLTDLR